VTMWWDGRAAINPCQRQPVWLLARHVVQTDRTADRRQAPMTDWPDDWFRESPSASQGCSPWYPRSGRAATCAWSTRAVVPGRVSAEPTAHFPTDPRRCQRRRSRRSRRSRRRWPLSHRHAPPARRTCRPARLWPRAAIRAAMASPAGGAG
jgi:hypothetical protein